MSNLLMEENPLDTDKLSAFFTFLASKKEEDVQKWPPCNNQP